MTTHKQVRSTEEVLTLAMNFIERTESYLPTSFDSDGLKIHAMLKEALMSFQDGAQPAVSETHKRKPLDEREREWILATCPTPRHIIKAVEAAHGIVGETHE